MIYFCFTDVLLLLTANPQHTQTRQYVGGYAALCFDLPESGKCFLRIVIMMAKYLGIYDFCPVMASVSAGRRGGGLGGAAAA